jgi:phosphoribosylformylglycinamidine cyclo-ligase/phosphoribosylamine--glycine ligase/phosphoribosylformylglycinamidine cyclo-ligase
MAASLIKTPLEELTYKVNGLAMQAQSELRAGHRESVYQARLVELLRGLEIQVEAEKRIEVFANDSLIGYMYIDLWVEQQLVVECKAFPHMLTNDEISQVITYLAATGSAIGLLYNFGRSKLEFKRILPPSRVQDWQSHVYRCIWTPPGTVLPPIDSLTTPIRFSVVSPHHSSPPAELPSASIRLSVTESVDDPSVENPSIEDSAYAASGVSIDAGNRAVDLMRESVRATYGPQVLAGIGAFGGLYSAAALKAMHDPVLVASTDGVGTKVKLAARAGRYDSIGHDIVNHCVNDILVQGARPLFFLDYIASSRLDPEMVAAVVRGIAAACKEACCALLGGETAEMPGVYQPGEFDVAGTVVGLVERSALLPRGDLKAGNVLIGLRSSGPHTNGYSLIRRVFEDTPLDRVLPELGGSLADALLAPHRSYLNVLPDANGQLPTSLKALAHLTGGGFVDNIPRVLPDHLTAQIHLGSWPVPPLFSLIQQHGEIDPAEMYRVFNMGIGMIAIVEQEDVARFQSSIGEETFVIGELIAGDRIAGDRIAGDRIAGDRKVILK